jgi:uncharacterized protein
MQLLLPRLVLLLIASLAPAIAQTPTSQATPAPGKAPMNGYDRSVPLPRYPDPYAGKPKVLFVADVHTGNQIAHDAVSHAMASMEEVARKAGIVVYLRTDTNWVSAEDTYGKGDYVKGGSKGAKGRSLKDFDAVIFYTNGETEMTDQQKEDLLAYIRSGKGFVGIHTAAATMYKYPAYADMLGAYFDNHPWGIVTAKIKVERPDFPGMDAFVGQPTVTEEFYQMMAPYDRTKVDVLARIDPATVDLSSPNVHRTDADFPIAWIKNYGQGRVFYSSLGHPDAAWDDPRVQNMYLDAIKWAAGLIQYPVKPHPIPHN